MFKRRKHKNREQHGTQVSDKAAGIIARFILKVQHGFASVLGRKTADLQRRGKIMLLVTICLVFGGLSFSSLIQVFTGSVDKTQPWRPDQLRVPRHYDKTGDVETGGAFVTEATYKKLQGFSRYMDSLRQTAKGKVKYDSIILARPGLVDSVEFLEQLYNSQQKQ